MSDFLTRLARRQLGEIPTVQPRVPALYAPMAGEPAPQTRDFGSEPSAMTAINRQPFELVSKPHTSAPLEKPRVTSASSLPVPLPDDGRLIFEEARKVDGQIQFETKFSEDRTPQSDNRPSFTEGPAKDLRSLSVEPSPPDSWTHAQPKPPASAISVTEKPAFFPVEKTITVAHARLVEAKASNQPIAPQRLNAPNASREFPGQRASLQEQALEAAEAPVHVTIGSIEVTAVTSAPEAKRAPMTRKKSMSLDEYLARRQRGKR